MEVIPLSPSVESIFWKRVNQDIYHYHFFAFDWKHHRDLTKILLALEGNQIDGMLLIYDNRIVQLRGSPEAAELLLAELHLTEVELQAPQNHKQHILKKYRPRVRHEMVLMLLPKGEERTTAEHGMVRLDQSDAEQIATMMRTADPEVWGKVTEQLIAERMANRHWSGIRVDGKLVSIGSALVTEWGGHIGVVATDEAHRNRGYGTSIVSELVKLIFEETSTAMIHVLKDNPPAIRAYEKVGFKPYTTYFFMKGEKR